MAMTADASNQGMEIFPQLLSMANTAATIETQNATMASPDDTSTTGFEFASSFIGIHIASSNRIGPLQHTLLWLFFVAAIVVATIQVRKEYKILKTYKRPDPADLEASSGVNHAMGESEAQAIPGPAIGSADITRSMFRRMLLAALVLRAIVLPFQGIASNPQQFWFQVTADTLPEMTFCSAWTLLVKFLVQLVGIASGESSTSSSPTFVIQLCAWAMYVTLVITERFNPTGGGMVIYCLLAFIYTGLFGLSASSGFQLVVFLRPSLSLSRHSALAVRLAATCVICAFVFGSRIIGFCLTVIEAGQAGPYGVAAAAPDNKGSWPWWWSYGCLELVPSALFLIMMHTRNPAGRGNANGGNSNNSTPTTTPPLARGQVQGFPRTSSYSSTSSAAKRESAQLLRPGGPGTYGSTLASGGRD